jgi:hypothetical protein
MYNPTNESESLKDILKKINTSDKIDSKYLNENEISYIRNNIENIKFHKCKNKNNYLISGLCDFSEIVIVSKK